MQIGIKYGCQFTTYLLCPAYVWIIVYYVLSTHLGFPEFHCNKQAKSLYRCTITVTFQMIILVWSNLATIGISDQMKCQTIVNENVKILSTKGGCRGQSTQFNHLLTIINPPLGFEGVICRLRLSGVGSSLMTPVRVTKTFYFIFTDSCALESFVSTWVWLENEAKKLRFENVQLWVCLLTFSHGKTPHEATWNPTVPARRQGKG